MNPATRTLLLAACAVAACFGSAPPRASAGDAPTVAATSPTPEELEARYVASPTDLAGALAMAEAWVQAGKREHATRVIAARLGTAADDAVARFVAGWLEGGESGCAAMWSVARSGLGPAPQATPGLVVAYDALARLEEARGRADLAMVALEQRVALAPAVGAWMRLAWLREAAGQLGGAEAAYRQAVKLAPDHAPARGALALVLARTPGKAREARTLVEQGVAKQPESAEAHLHLGMVKALAGDVPGALKAYEAAFERAQRDPATLTALGAAYGALEQWDLAQKALAAALAHDAGRADAVLQSAALAVQREQWAEAKKLLTQAGRLAPRSAQVAFLQGVVAQRTQQLDGAIERYRKAVELAPTEAGYRLALVSVILERGNLDAALAALKDAAEACPAEPGIPLRQGFVLMQKKRWGPAVEAFLAAARLAPKDPDPHLYLAVIRGDHQDNPAQARLHLEEYKKRGGKEPSALSWLDALSK